MAGVAVFVATLVATALSTPAAATTALPTDAATILPPGSEYTSTKCPSSSVLCGIHFNKVSHDYNLTNTSTTEGIEKSESITEISPEQQLHTYIDKAVNGTELNDLLKIVQTIVTRGTSSAEGNTTVLQDIENVVQKTKISTGRFYKIEELRKVSVAVEVADVNVPTVMTFKIIEGRREINQSWSVKFFSNVSNEYLRSSEQDIAIIFPPANTSEWRTAIAYDDPKSLLRENNTPNGKRLNSVVVNVNVYDDDRNVTKPPFIDIIFKKKKNASGCEKYVCEYWNHSQTDEGHWSSDGCEMVRTTDDKVICHCLHLSHFGSLIQPVPMELGSVDNKILDFITYLGCAMSLFGVVWIAVVAVMNRKWRSETGHKLVLCLAVNVALKTALFLPVAVGVAKTGDACIAVGALLHYLLLASFMWTLVSAWLQYRRYVVGIYTPVTHLILKLSVISWALPILPVAALLSIDSDIYANENISCHDRTLCFPRHPYFHVTVTGPVGIVVLANAFIFVRIIHSLYGCTRKVRPTRGGSKPNRLLMMVVYEFFLLGLPWVFGLISGVHKIFLYLFCLTATQHGFILYLFFVFLKKNKGKGKHSENLGGVSYTSDLQPRHQNIENGFFNNISEDQKNDVGSRL